MSHQILRVSVGAEVRVGKEYTDLDQPFDAFLDAQRVRLESHGELSRDLVDQIVMRHMFPVLHDAHDGCLQSSNSD